MGAETTRLGTANEVSQGDTADQQALRDLFDKVHRAGGQLDNPEVVPEGDPINEILKKIDAVMHEDATAESVKTTINQLIEEHGYVPVFTALQVKIGMITKEQWNSIVQEYEQLKTEFKAFYEETVRKWYHLMKSEEYSNHWVLVDNSENLVYRWKSHNGLHYYDYDHFASLANDERLPVILAILEFFREHTRYNQAYGDSYKGLIEQSNGKYQLDCDIYSLLAVDLAKSQGVAMTIEEYGHQTLRSGHVNTSIDRPDGKKQFIEWTNASWSMTQEFRKDFDSTGSFDTAQYNGLALWLANMINDQIVHEGLLVESREEKLQMSDFLSNLSDGRYRAWIITLVTVSDIKEEEEEKEKQSLPITPIRGMDLKTWEEKLESYSLVTKWNYGILPMRISFKKERIAYEDPSSSFSQYSTPAKWTNAIPVGTEEDTWQSKKDIMKSVVFVQYSIKDTDPKNQNKRITLEETLYNGFLVKQLPVTAWTEKRSLESYTHLPVNAVPWSWLSLNNTLIYTDNASSLEPRMSNVSRLEAKQYPPENNNPSFSYPQLNTILQEVKLEDRREMTLDSDPHFLQRVALYSVTLVNGQKGYFVITEKNDTKRTMHCFPVCAVAWSLQLGHLVEAVQGTSPVQYAFKRDFFQYTKEQNTLDQSLSFDQAISAVTSRLYREDQQQAEGSHVFSADLLAEPELLDDLPQYNKNQQERYPYAYFPEGATIVDGDSPTFMFDDDKLYTKLFRFFDDKENKHFLVTGKTFVAIYNDKNKNIKKTRKALKQKEHASKRLDHLSTGLKKMSNEKINEWYEYSMSNIQSFVPERKNGLTFPTHIVGMNRVAERECNAFLRRDSGPTRLCHYEVTRDDGRVYPVLMYQPRGWETYRCFVFKQWTAFKQMLTSHEEDRSWLPLWSLQPNRDSLLNLESLSLDEAFALIDNYDENN